MEDLYPSTDDKFDDGFVRDLLERYHSEVDPKTRVNLRNTIVELLLPLVQERVRRWGDYACEDLFQDAVLQLFTIIEKWIPNRGSIGGYFRRSLDYFCNAKTRALGAREGWVILDETAVEEYPTKDVLFFESIPTNSDLTDVYHFALDWIIDDPSSMVILRKTIRKKFGLSPTTVEWVVQNALVTAREQIHGYPVSRYLDVDENSVFNRMLYFSRSATLEEIREIYGGLTIKVPRRKNGRAKAANCTRNTRRTNTTNNRRGSGKGKTTC